MGEEKKKEIAALNGHDAATAEAPTFESWHAIRTPQISCIFLDRSVIS
jgi:hypothetical protein